MRLRHRLMAVLGAAAAMCLARTSAAEQTPYRVPRVEAAIRIDGALDEAFWSEALVLSIDYEVSPGENIPAPVKTECLLAYTATHIYVGFRAYDPDPSEIRAHLLDRDQAWIDDWVGVFFDTFNDGLRDYGFMCNPLGVQTDLIETSDGLLDSAWDAIWDSAGRITEEGYFVEMSIPFAAMSFQRGEGDQIWGLDAVRDMPRSVRHHLGVFPRDRNNNCYMCQAIKLVGFAGAKPGRNVEITPTLSGIFSQRRADVTAGPFEDAEKKADPGLTVRWGFTPSMTLSATANPDFSQVEADAVQLDINTQFALFYEEKRPFFLQGADFFDTRLPVLHTRTFADPNFGLKIDGKEGANTIGLFVVQDDVTNLVFPGSEESGETSLDRRSLGSVFRYRRDVFGSSNLGIIATDREGDDYYSRLAGVDGNVRLTPKDIVRFQAVGSHTRYPVSVAADYDQPAGSFTGAAFDVGYGHRTRSIDVFAVAGAASDDFRADLGFVPQVDYRYVESGAGYIWNGSAERWFSRIEAGASYEHAETYGGKLLHRGPEVSFEYEGPKQTEIVGEAQWGIETYGGREYDARRVHADMGFWPAADLRLFICSQGGDRIDYANARPGAFIRLSPEVDYRLGRHLSFSLAHTFERLAIDAGRLYSADISRFRAVYQLSRRTFVRAIVQFVDYRRNASLYAFDVNTRDQRMQSQFLFSYKINPQTVLFLGYSDGYAGGDANDLVQTDRTFFAKVGYAWTL